MKDKEYLNKENIYNLTTLWSLAGEMCGSFKTNGNINLSNILNSDWPSRIWFSKQRSSIGEDDLVIASKNSLKLSLWEDSYGESPTSSPIEPFTVLTTHQTAMYLPKPWLKDSDDELTIDLKHVKDSKEADTWSKLFEQAFGYTIPSSVVKSTSRFTNYYIAHSEGESVGTVMLFIDYHNNAGIHALGVSPAFRRRGFAKEITLASLQLLINENPENIFLQASDAAVNLYRKLGFKDQFEMHTYSFSNTQ
ncbi:GNAT family N-acetyltransferase [Gracilimonas tropica]|uniref:GNAT family N-acetyltransferase n=1 Tax=Gracilimonas tropica TaxID=454600 RepID=UPI00037E5CAB|nr:GNAT family N-acetyltransferase [Gracilimonas tropica]